MIYIQSYNKYPLWDFGSSALHACLNQGYDFKLIEEWKVPPSDATCLIGSVEWCRNWLRENGHIVPDAMKLSDFSEYLGRDVWIQDSKEFLETNTKWPIFIKPFDQIKAFTGTIVTSNFDAHCVLQDFEGDLCVQTSIDPIFSEWRVYVNRRRVVGCKPYKGSNLIFPNKDIIENCVNHALSLINNVSFTLDFGVTGFKIHQLEINHQMMSDTAEVMSGDKFSEEKNLEKTFLIEPNDGWAIGNYGLEPEDYLRFCKDRWQQMIKS